MSRLRNVTTCQAYYRDDCSVLYSALFADKMTIVIMLFMRRRLSGLDRGSGARKNAHASELKPYIIIFLCGSWLRAGVRTDLSMLPGAEPFKRACPESCEDGEDQAPACLPEAAARAHACQPESARCPSTARPPRPMACSCGGKSLELRNFKSECRAAATPRCGALRCRREGTRAARPMRRGRANRRQDPIPSVPASFYSYKCHLNIYWPPGARRQGS